MRRSPQQRRRDRAAGIDGNGRALARTLQLSPRSIRAFYPELTYSAARAFSDELVRRERALR